VGQGAASEVTPEAPVLGEPELLAAGTSLHARFQVVPAALDLVAPAAGEAEAEPQGEEEARSSSEVVRRLESAWSQMAEEHQGLELCKSTAIAALRQLQGPIEKLFVFRALLSKCESEGVGVLPELPEALRPSHWWERSHDMALLRKVQEHGWPGRASNLEAIREDLTQLISPGFATPSTSQVASSDGDERVKASSTASERVMPDAKALLKRIKGLEVAALNPPRPPKLPKLPKTKKRQTAAPVIDVDDTIKAADAGKEVKKGKSSKAKKTVAQSGSAKALKVKKPKGQSQDAAKKASQKTKVTAPKAQAAGKRKESAPSGRLAEDRVVVDGKAAGWLIHAMWRSQGSATSDKLYFSFLPPGTQRFLLSKASVLAAHSEEVWEALQFEKAEIMQSIKGARKEAPKETENPPRAPNKKRPAAASDAVPKDSEATGQEIQEARQVIRGVASGWVVRGRLTKQNIITYAFRSPVGTRWELSGTVQKSVEKEAWKILLEERNLIGDSIRAQRAATVAAPIPAEEAGRKLGKSHASAEPGPTAASETQDPRPVASAARGHAELDSDGAQAV